MSLNTNIEKFFKIKNNLENKLMTEGLTKNEKVILETVKKEINEAPMTFGQEVGGGRPSRTLQQKIEGGGTPLNWFDTTSNRFLYFRSI
jgi:hypothetical protein